MLYCTDRIVCGCVHSKLCRWIIYSRQIKWKNLKTGGDLLIFFFSFFFSLWDVPGSFHIYVSSELTLLFLWCSMFWILTCVNLSQRKDQWVSQSRLAPLQGDGDILQTTLKWSTTVKQGFFLLHVWKVTPGITYISQTVNCILHRTHNIIWMRTYKRQIMIYKCCFHEGRK